MYNKIKTITLLIISILYKSNLMSDVDKNSLKLISDKIKEAKTEVSLNNIIKALIMFEKNINLKKCNEVKENSETTIIYDFIKKISKVTNDKKYLNKIEEVNSHPVNQNQILSIFKDYTIHLEKYFLKINKQEVKYNEISEVLDSMFETIAKLPKTNNNFTEKLFGFKKALEKTNNLTNIKKLKGNILGVISDIQTEIKDFNSNMNQILEENIKFANSKIKALEVKVDQVVNESYIDALTGSLNRKWLEDNFDDFFWFERKNDDLFILLDIDHFKLVNDTFGHTAGDFVLSELVHRFKEALRENKNDKIIRYGGDEFILILTDVKKDHIDSILTRLKNIINTKNFVFDGKEMNLSISMGASMFKEAESTKDIFDLTDRKLYKAKENGRNCFVKEV